MLDGVKQPDRGLKKFLRITGIKNKDLEDLTGLSRATVSRHVRGERAPSFQDRLKYAELLKVPIEQIHEAFVGVLSDGASSTTNPSTDLPEWAKQYETLAEAKAALVEDLSIKELEAIIAKKREDFKPGRKRK